VWRSRHAFLAWLRTLAHAEVIDRLRYHAAKRRRPEAEQTFDDGRQQSPTRGMETRAQQAQQQALLTSFLPSLSEEQRTALSLHHSGHSHAEVAAVLGCSAEAARKHVARGEAKLVELLTQAQAARNTNG
jgi:RNA polymerase sigma factor (sigma-70 family)